MKIGIDATIIRTEITGTGYYIINLVNGLKELTLVNNHKFFIFIDRCFLSYFNNLPSERFIIIHKKFRNRFFRIFWQLFIFSVVLKKLNVKVLHSTNYITPIIKFNIKVVVTIHDLTVLLFPEKHSFFRSLFYKLLLPIFIRKSDKIITVSNSSKRDLLRFFKDLEDKIIVTFEGISESYKIKNYEKCLKIMQKYNINKKFLLFVGMIEPRKNVLRILEAFINLDDEINLDLVIVGKMGWKFNDINEFIKNHPNNKIKNNIIFTGYVPEEEIRYIYQSAYIFIYPSIYEGFGIPPLISMSCGVPVITSNTSSLPEVVGDAAFKINPLDLNEIIEAIRSIYKNNELREYLVKKGFEQSKQFTNYEFAKRTFEIYNNL